MGKIIVKKTEEEKVISALPSMIRKAFRESGHHYFQRWGGAPSQLTKGGFALGGYERSTKVISYIDKNTLIHEIIHACEYQPSFEPLERDLRKLLIEQKGFVHRDEIAWMVQWYITSPFALLNTNYKVYLIIYKHLGIPKGRKIKHINAFKDVFEEYRIRRTQIPNELISLYKKLTK